MKDMGAVMAELKAGERSGEGGAGVTGRRAAFAALATLAAGACGDPAEEADEPLAVATPAVSQGPRRLIAEPLNLAALGPRIAGPQGEEVESAIEGVGTMVSYVACPASVGSETCDPASLPDDTLYTYVHQVTLAEDRTGEGLGDARVFRTIEPAPGFALTIGYDTDAAEAALGEGYDIRTEIEDGELIWRVVAGDGWQAGETLTFYWRSTLPPAGPAEAYGLEVDGVESVAGGPFPLPDRPRN